MTTTTALDIRPLSGNLGAEILGVDLSGPLGSDVVAEIRDTLLRWKVVFFRDQDLTQDQHVAFGRCFGEVTPAHPMLPAVFPEHPEILLIENKPAKSGDEGDKDSERAAKPAGRNNNNNLWHTDMTFLPNPPMGSILRGVVVPEYGGDTQWTNLVVAYEELSPSIQKLCDDLHAMHDSVRPLKESNLSSAMIRQFQSQELQTVHPVVRVHPETGEKALFVNPAFTDHILELSPKESKHLLSMLFEHLASPAFTCRFRWRPGSIAFWDNRATCHIVPADVPPGARRSMQRITVAGDVPVGPNGESSYALGGESR